MRDVMEREIRAQGEYVVSCLPAMRESLLGLDLEAERVVMAGCGDSYYSAVAAAGIYRALGVPYAAVTAQEVAQFLPLQPRDLVVLASVSGSTKRTVEAAERSRGAGVATLALTCDGASALARASERTLVLPYEPISRATPHTLDYTLTLLAQALVAERLAGRTLEALGRLPEVLEASIDEAFRMLPPALEGHTAASRTFFLGAGADVGTAAYGAAKLHEAGGRTAFAGESENFWHGMNFMLQPSDLVMVFGNRLESARTEELLVAGLAQVARTVVYVGDEGVAAPHRVAVPNVGQELAPFVSAIAPQVACLLIARREAELGADASGESGSERQLAVQRAWFGR
jgi:fructoselysine-6-P-deglycase FrlB-like protein